VDGLQVAVGALGYNLYVNIHTTVGSSSPRNFGKPGILGGGLVFLVGSWAGGVWLGGLAALTVAAVLLIRRRRTGC
jgi:hypothetical protein